jgi:hypothetical protein
VDFLEIQNEAMFDRFGEPRRASIKRYINARYGRIWAQEAWSFKRALVTTTVTTSTVSLAALGLQRIEGAFRTSGTTNAEIYPDRPEDFQNWLSTVSGRPYGYTVYGDTLTLERSPSSSEVLHLVGELKFDPLVNDGDEPLLPEEFHMMLVHGAVSEALRMENDPTWQGAEQDYNAYLADLRAGYLTAVRTYGDSYPAWVPAHAIYP